MRKLTPEEWDELREIDWYLYYFPELYYASDQETRNKLVFLSVRVVVIPSRGFTIRRLQAVAV